MILQRNRRVGVMHCRRIGRQLKFRQNRIDHGFVSFPQIRQQNLVLNQLGCFALQLCRIGREQILKTFPRFRPILFQKWNLSQIETRIPKFRVKVVCFRQCGFGFVVDALAHVDDTTQILRGRQIRFPCVNRIQFL